MKAKRETQDVDSLQESLKRSQVNRQAMMKKFGFIPLSVLSTLGRGSISKSLFVYQHDVPQRNMAHLPANKEKRERLREAGYTDFKNSPSSRMAGRGTLGATIMPAELVDFFIKYYSYPRSVYLDPFMGQGIQMQVAKMMKLDYYGYDISEEFFAYIDSVRSKIDDGSTTISVHCGDSRFPDKIPNNIGDFCFTSPPYWDIEFYGEEDGQLGYKQSYDEFLVGMYDVARAWHPKFKKGAYVVVNVNDFRKDGRYYPYHADTIGLFTRAGYEMTDTWIIEGFVGGLPKAFAVDFNMKKIAPKVHEYALVFTVP
jgi:DNA modification methylase